MESVSVSGVSVSVALIIEGFAEASQLFKKWRKQRGKKVVGQEELESSLYVGEAAVDKRLGALIAEHGNKFDAGDAQSRASLFKIRTDFRKGLIDVLQSAMAREEGKKVVIDPVALRLVSESTQKDTILAMGNLSQRLKAPQSPKCGGGPDPDDILPVFPPPPRSTPNANNTSLPNKIRKSPPSNQSKASLSADPTPMSSQASLSGSDTPVSASSSQASLEKPQSAGGREEVYTPRSTPNPIYPYAGSGGSASSSQSLVRRMPSSKSLISRMFSTVTLTQRPYSNIPPLPPIPTIVPSYKCTGDSEDVLEEGREEVDRLWAMADSVWETPQDKRPHSAPLVQEEWSTFLKDEFDDMPPPSASAIMPPPKEYSTPTPPPAPITHQLRPPLEIGKRIRSEPTITFSRPTPRFGRNVSGPLESC